MKTTLKRISALPLYPFILGLYPSIALLAYNLGEVRPSAILRSILFVELAVLIFLLVLRLVLREWHRAAFIVSIWLLLISSYGQVYDLLQNKASHFANHTWLTITWFVLGIGLTIWAVTRHRGRMGRFTPGFNLVALALIIYPTYQVTLYYGFLQRDRSFTPTVSAAPADKSLPDIYFIILDMHTREDNLMAAYGYDESGFIKDMQDMGFYVAQCSASNYMRTEPTLSSVLNMDYLPGMDPGIKSDSWSRAPMWNLIRNSLVRQKLEAAGYKTVAFATGYPWSEIDNSDVYLQPHSLFGQMNSFETLLVNTSWARALEDNGTIDMTSEDAARFRERTLYTLDTLPTLASMPGPKFVFVHIISPHPPFVMGPDGPLDAASYLNKDAKYTSQAFEKGYKLQLAFIDKRISEAMKELIANSSRPPVIIIQGDHGPWLQPQARSFPILNAYYLPDERAKAMLYPSISPVNSFRVVLDTYLGTDYKLLPDISYYSPIPMIYQFSEVNVPCPAK